MQTRKIMMRRTPFHMRLLDRNQRPCPHFPTLLRSSGHGAKIDDYFPLSTHLLMPQAASMHDGDEIFAACAEMCPKVRGEKQKDLAQKPSMNSGSEWKGRGVMSKPIHIPAFCTPFSHVRYSRRINPCPNAHG